MISFRFSREIFDRLGLSAALTLAFCHFHLTTKHGIGLGNDSLAFTGPALAYLAGEESVSLHHPPLFGWLLAGVAKLTGLDVTEAAVVLQFLSLVGLISGVWCQLRWSLPAQPGASAWAALTVATAYPVVEHAGNLGSDLLGAALAVWALGMLVRHTSASGGIRTLAPCLVLAALSLLNRFAGFGVVLAIAVFLWLHRGKPWGRDLLVAIGTGFVMVFPCSLHLIANAIKHGQATSREIGWNGIPWDRIQESLATLARWYVPQAFSSWAIGFALLAGAAIWFRITRGKSATPALRNHLLIVTIFFSVNMVFLICVISLTDHWLALDSRTLLPALPATLIAGVLLAQLTPAAWSGRKFLIVTASALFFGINLHRTMSLVASYQVLGRGHTGVNYRHSSLPDFVHLHYTAAFATNNPPWFFNLTRCEALPLPTTFNLFSNRPNPAADSEVEVLRSQLRAKPEAFLVLFEQNDNPCRISPTRLTVGENWTRVLHEPFVSVFKYSPTTPYKTSPSPHRAL